MSNPREVYDRLYRELREISIGNSEAYFNKLDEVIEASRSVEKDKRTSIDINFNRFSGIKKIENKSFPMQVSVVLAIARGEVGIVFRNCTFTQGLVVSKCHINRGLSFLNCNFSGPISFLESNISSGLTIQSDIKSEIDSLDFSTSMISDGINISNISISGTLAWPRTCQRGKIRFSSCIINSVKNDKLMAACSDVDSFDFDDVEFVNGFKASGHGLMSTKEVSLKNVRAPGKDMIFHSMTGNGYKLSILSCKFDRIEIKRSSANEIEISSSQFKELVMSEIPSNSSIKLTERGLFREEIDDIDLTLSGNSTVDIDLREIGSLVLRGSPYESVKINKAKIDSFSISNGARIGQELVIKSSVFGKFDVAKCIFENSCLIVGCTFKQAPNFKGVEFEYNDVSFYKCKFKDVSSKYAVASYRRLKLLMSEIKNDVEEHNFSGLEMHSRRKTLSWIAPELPLSWVYHGLNNYGRSILKPILILVFLTFVMKQVYIHNSHFYEPNDRYKETSLYQNFSKLTVPQKAQKVSIVNSLGPMRFFMSPQVFIPTKRDAQSTFFAQNVATSILWFLIIMGIRRRFKTH